MFKHYTSTRWSARFIKRIVSLEIEKRDGKRFRYSSVGDSHSACTYYAGLSDVVHLGPVTMYRIGRDCNLASLMICSLLGMDDEHGVPRYLRTHMYRLLSATNVVLFFGEIDCRVHVHKHIALDESVDNTCGRLASQYIAAIKAMQAQHPKVQFITSSIVPPTNFTGDVNFPTAGRLDERVMYTNSVNNHLSQLSVEYGLRYADFAKNIPVGTDGAMLDQYHDGTVHLNRKYAYLIDQELVRLGL